MKQKEKPSIVLSFRLPKDLIKRVDTCADQEYRNRVSMVFVLLKEALDARDARDKAQKKA